MSTRDINVISFVSCHGDGYRAAFRGPNGAIFYMPAEQLALCEDHSEEGILTIVTACVWDPDAREFVVAACDPFYEGTFPPGCHHPEAGTVARGAITLPAPCSLEAVAANDALASGAFPVAGSRTRGIA